MLQAEIPIKVPEERTSTAYFTCLRLYQATPLLLAAKLELGHQPERCPSDDFLVFVKGAELEETLP